MFPFCFRSLQIPQVLFLGTLWGVWKSISDLEPGRPAELREVGDMSFRPESPTPPSMATQK